MHQFYAAATWLLLSAIPVFGQQTATDSLNTRLNALEKNLAIFKNLKITGYVQAEWQLAAKAGIKSYAGGDFPANANNRFTVRRGRLKLVFTQPGFQLFFQPEFTERGVALKDAFGMVTEPWLKQFSLTAGIFNRPFSFENIYSSGLRETPERARFAQIMLPNERETGAMLSWKWKDLKLDGGLFNGNAVAQDNDSRKDFIGRASYSKTRANSQFGAAFSYYRGSVRENSNQVFEFEARNSEHQAGMFPNDTLEHPQLGHFARRAYFGADVQYTFHWALGKTTLRAEAIAGKQPGTEKSNESARTRDGLSGDIYIRSTSGGTAYFIQGLGKSAFQLVLKYDWFDPNTEVAGAELGQAGSHFSSADVRYTTWGAGLNYYWENLTIQLHYDWVRNEKATGLTGFEQDIKDNVLTIRTQVKF